MAGPASCPPWHRAGRSSAAPKARPDLAAPEIRGDFECETYRMGPPFEIAVAEFYGLWYNELVNGFINQLITGGAPCRDLNGD
jgi:hypothetical protein